MSAFTTNGATPTALTLVSDQTITGAAAASFTFNNPLNLEGDNNYLLKAYLVNNDLAAGHYVDFTMNNDTTDANYMEQYLTGQLAAVAAGSGANRRIAQFFGGSGAQHALLHLDILVKKVAGQFPIAMCRAASYQPVGGTPSIDVWEANIMRLNTENITRLDLSVQGGANLAIGSRATLYKVV